MKNSSDNVFEGIPVGPGMDLLVTNFLAGHDFAAESRRAFVQDLRKLARWFSTANSESFQVDRLSTRDVSDFRDHLRRDRKQAVATVNRSLVTIRRFCEWLVKQGKITVNPAAAVKELRRQPLAPKGLDPSQVRRLLREVELRGDVRANAVFSLLLFTGCRVGDLVSLEQHDLMLSERGGSVVFRTGKGNKQRTVPLPLQARRALATYLESRPPLSTAKVFVGERGPLTDRGVRTLCDKYSAITGIRFHPHLLRHTFAHRFLADNQNDLVSLAQILGHESLNTTSRYTQRTSQQLLEATDRVTY